MFMRSKRYDDAKSILEEFKDFERYNPNIIAQMTELFDLEKFRYKKYSISIINTHKHIIKISISLTYMMIFDV